MENAESQMKLEQEQQVNEVASNAQNTSTKAPKTYVKYHYNEAANTFTQIIFDEDSHPLKEGEPQTINDIIENNTTWYMDMTASFTNKWLPKYINNPEQNKYIKQHQYVRDMMMSALPTLADKQLDSDARIGITITNIQTIFEIHEQGYLTDLDYDLLIKWVLYRTYILDNPITDQLVKTLATNINNYYRHGEYIYDDTDVDRIKPKLPKTFAPTLRLVNHDKQKYDSIIEHGIVSWFRSHNMKVNSNKKDVNSDKKDDVALNHVLAAQAIVRAEHYGLVSQRTLDKIVPVVQAEYDFLKPIMLKNQILLDEAPALRDLTDQICDESTAWWGVEAEKVAKANQQSTHMIDHVFLGLTNTWGDFAEKHDQNSTNKPGLSAVEMFQSKIIEIQERAGVEPDDIQPEQWIELLQFIKQVVAMTMPRKYFEWEPFTAYVKKLIPLEYLHKCNKWFLTMGTGFSMNEYRKEREVTIDNVWEALQRRIDALKYDVDHFVVLNEYQRAWIERNAEPKTSHKYEYCLYDAHLSKDDTSLHNETLEEIQQYNPWITWDKATSTMKSMEIPSEKGAKTIHYQYVYIDGFKIDYQALAQEVIDYYHLYYDGKHYVYAWNYNPDRPNTWISTPKEQFTIFVDKALEALNLGQVAAEVTRGQRAFLTALDNKLSNRRIASKFDEDSYNLQKAVKIQFENGVLDLYNWDWQDYTVPEDFIPVTIPYKLSKKDIENVTHLHEEDEVKLSLQWLADIMGDKYNPNVTAASFKKGTPKDLPQTMIYFLTYLGGIFTRQNNITAKGRDHRDNYMLLLYSPEAQHGKSAITQYVRKCVSGNHDSDNLGNHTSLTLDSLNGSRFSKANLQNSLLDVFDDMKYASKNNASLLKQILGGDSMQSERKNEQDQEIFKPFCKIMCSANGLPKIIDRSGGMPDRMAAIHMPTEINAEFRDKYPLDIIEDPEVMHKVVIISLYLYHIWLRGDQYKWNPYAFSSSMNAATNKWVNASNPSRQVVGSLVSHDPNGCVNAALLYKLYQVAMKNDGHTPLTKEEFDKCLTLTIGGNWKADKARKKKQIPVFQYSKYLKEAQSFKAKLMAAKHQSVDPTAANSMAAKEDAAQTAIYAAYNRADAGADDTGNIIDLDEMSNYVSNHADAAAQFVRGKRVEVYEGISFNNQWDIIQDYIDSRAEISKTPYQDTIKQVCEKMTVDDYYLADDEAVLPVNYDKLGTSSSLKGLLTGLSIKYAKWHDKQATYIDRVKNDAKQGKTVTVGSHVNIYYTTAYQELTDPNKSATEHQQAQQTIDKFEKSVSNE